jgi:glucose/mannose-6-phosphate isomerase
MMETAIKNFSKQFNWQPKITGKLSAYKKFVVCGMGGSHLAGDILLSLNPEIDLTIHSDYGLPRTEKNSLVIVSSYSGNTEEVIDSYQCARQKKLPLVVIAVGGKLIELAKKDGVPYVLLPDTGVQPRSALGFSLLGLLKVTKQSILLKQAHQLADRLDPVAAKRGGEALARKIQNQIPLIYCSHRKQSVAFNWKIKFNESGKIPAFYNVLPELNHNEMTGFDGNTKSKKLAEKFHVIVITDEDDHPRIQKRMVVLKNQYQARGLPVTIMPMVGRSALEKIFSSLLIADWCALATANFYGSESEQVPMVEEFKKLMK